jgi:hypothetical protein
MPKGDGLQIRPLCRPDIKVVTAWARAEDFAPGLGDGAIYRHTDRQGLWLGWLGEEPVVAFSGFATTPNTASSAWRLHRSASPPMPAGASNRVQPDPARLLLQGLIARHRCAPAG